MQSHPVRFNYLITLIILYKNPASIILDKNSEMSLNCKMFLVYIYNVIIAQRGKILIFDQQILLQLIMSTAVSEKKGTFICELTL